MPNITAAPVTHKILSKQRNLLVENTTTETDLWTYTVPANTLGTLNALHVRIIGSILNSAGTVSFILKWYYGATVLFNDSYASLTTNAARRPLDFDVVLAGNNATNAQVFGGNMMLSIPIAATIGTGDLATDEQQGLSPINGVDSAEDSTASKVFKLTVTPSTASVNAEILISQSYTELIQ